MGFPKSLPPVMRKPQGAGPAKVTVTGMAAGGSGQAGSGDVGKSRGALCSSGRHSPAAPPAPHPEGPKHGVTESGSAFLPGRGPMSLCCHKVPAATAASSCRPAVPSWGWWLPPSGGHEGTHCWLRWCCRWAGAGEVTPLSLAQGRKLVPARQFVARQGQASGFGGDDEAARAASSQRGTDPAAHCSGGAASASTLNPLPHSKPALGKDAEGPPGWHRVPKAPQQAP